MKPQFMIWIPPHHAHMPVIHEVSTEEDKSAIHDDKDMECEMSKQVSNVPDFSHGMTHSGKQQGQIQVILATDNFAEDTVVMSAITGDPANIEDALAPPGDEGEAWEQAHQAEWHNMIEHDIFGPPMNPPPNMKVLKMGTTLSTSCQNGKITKQKVHIMAKGYSQVPGLHFNKTYAPVMQWESLHIILVLGAILSMPIH